MTVIVSIHTPTWGVTDGDACNKLVNVAVSIHTPTWGVTIFFFNSS